MKGSWYEQDGLPHERSSENVTSCSQRKLVDWQTKNEISGDEDSDSGSEKGNLPVFDWIINIKLLNETWKKVAICKYCKNILILTEKASQRAGLATELTFKCTNDKCKSHHNKGFFTFTKRRGVYDINRKSVLASRAVGKGCSGLEKFCSFLGLWSISRNTFTEHTKFWEHHASKLMDKL